jgi:imidazolonepropionase-like amidohydrolase
MRTISSCVNQFASLHLSDQEVTSGVIEVRAYAEMLLIDVNPLKNIELVANPENNFLINMKDRVIYKNTLK